MSDEAKVDEAQVAEWQSEAQQILASAWKGPVRLAAPELLRKPGYRNQIVRFAVADAPVGSPTSVIVKIAQGTPETPYDAKDDTPESPAWRLRNEVAGNYLVSSVSAADAPLSACWWGGSVPRAGLIVLEDLGKPYSLADAMQQDDPVRLRDALFRYAKGMGQLHAATIGHENAFSVTRDIQFRGETVAREAAGSSWLRDSVPAFREQAASLGVVLPAEWDAEMEKVVAVLDTPGPFLAFSPGDTCPDNHRLMEDGSLRFFDFEFAEFRHALLDAAYLCVPFPTCWCVNRLPETLTNDLIQAYRAELAAACPEANDDQAFWSGFAAACAYWTVATLVWSAKGALEKDSEWGISTVRQRIPFRLENFAHLAEQTQTFPAMAQVARALSEKLRALWESATEEMPLYLAFRDKKIP